MKKIILASQSPRRRELLKQIGLNFEVIPSQVGETLDSTGTAKEKIEKLALKKAKSVAYNMDQEALVIGADTVVVLDEILGKPSNRQDALSMLKRLSGRTHQVITGVAIVDALSGKQRTNSQITYVTMKTYGNEEIKSYMDSGEYLDKAGSYAIQGLGALLVEEIHGDYFNVVGLPIGLLSDLLKEFDFNMLSLYHKDKGNNF